MLALVSVGGLVGCKTVDTELPPGRVQVTAVREEMSAKQPVLDARRITADADRHNDTARTELTTAESRVTSYRDQEYRALQNLVSKLKAQGSAAKEELQELYDRVFAQEGEIAKLLERLGLITKELEAEKKLRKEVSDKLVEAQTKIVLKDKEAHALRGQFDDMKLTAQEFEANAKRNHEAALKKAGEVEFLKGRNSILMKILIGVSIALMISLLVHVLRFKRSLSPI